MDGPALTDKVLELTLLSLEGTPENSLLKIRSFTHPTQDDYSPDKAFWAMLIEWKNDIAERRGLEQIYQKALGNSFCPGPIWKEFLLG